MSNRKVSIRSVRKLIGATTVFVLTMALAGGFQQTNAEGTSQLNEQQTLSASTVLFADILNVGETINISVSTDTTINIFNTNGTLADTGDDTQVVTNASFTKNLVAANPVPNPVTGAYKYTPASAGTYRITFTGTQARYDFTVTADNTTDPNPTTAGGRVWSYKWSFSTGSFDLNSATDADFYALVPAPSGGQNFVWKLDLNKFAGNAYDLMANSIGLNSPYSGISASQGDATISPQYPIYLGYPAIAGSQNTTNPLITNQYFVDDAGVDDTISPSTTLGVQDTGYFHFTSNVSNATYAITIDTSKDGIYGVGDRLLLGSATTGDNSVLWDGNYPDGSPVPDGSYTARIQLRIGEFHFVAADVETSGGSSDAGATWNNGLTIYKATGPSTTENTTVYWDDLTELSGQDGATSNVPDGVTSGSLADSNNDGKADGFHTWGTFVSNSVGNSNYIDTYVYGASGTAFTNVASLQTDATDNDGITSATEAGAPNSGDANNDGQEDAGQSNVASLKNGVTDQYSTIATPNGCALSGVSVKNASSLSATDGKYGYPLGLFSFNVSCGSSGFTTTATQYFFNPSESTDFVLRKFVGGSFSDVSGATISRQTIGGVEALVVTYSITDGGALDEDGVANGTIVDPAGPARLLAGVTADPTPTPTPAVGIKAPNTGLPSGSPLYPAVASVLFGAGILIAVYRRR